MTNTYKTDCVGRVRGSRGCACANMEVRASTWVQLVFGNHIPCEGVGKGVDVRVYTRISKGVDKSVRVLGWVMWVSVYSGPVNAITKPDGPSKIFVRTPS